MYHIKIMTWIDIDIHDTSVARWRPQLPYGPLRPFCTLPCTSKSSSQRNWGVCVQSQTAQICGEINLFENETNALLSNSYHELSQTMMNFRISRQYCCLLWECTSKAELSRHSKCNCIAVKAYRCIQMYKWRLINSWKYCSDRFILLPSSSKPFATPLKFRKRPWKTPARRRRDAVPVSFQPRFHPSQSWMPRT